MILSIFPQICGYSRNYTVSENFHYASMAARPQPPYDVVTEIVLPSQEAFDEMMGQFSADPEKSRLIAEDETRFCDTDSMVLYLANESVTSL